MNVYLNVINYDTNVLKKSSPLKKTFSVSLFKYFKQTPKNLNIYK